MLLRQLFDHQHHGPGDGLSSEMRRRLDPDLRWHELEDDHLPISHHPDHRVVDRVDEQRLLDRRIHSIAQRRFKDGQQHDPRGVPVLLRFRWFHVRWSGE